MIIIAWKQCIRNIVRNAAFEKNIHTTVLIVLDDTNSRLWIESIIMYCGLLDNK